MSSIYDRELQEGTLFELLETEAYSDAVVALKIAHADISARILAIPDDTWTKKRLQAVQSQINTQIKAAHAQVLPKIQKELPDIARITSKNVLLNNFTKVPTGAMAAITSDSFNVQGYGAKELFKTVSDNHARQLRVMVAAGVAQGKTSKTIAAEVIRKSSKLTRGQLKNAIFTTVTEARAKVRHASYKLLEETGVVEGYQYVATLDSRTTEYCRNHDGRTYRKNIDDIAGEINVHFHCRSVFAPITKSTEAGVRASTFGQVPDEPYSVWFDRQSDQFQKATLGAQKFSAYKAGDYKIGGLPDVVGKVMTTQQIASALNVPAIAAEEQAEDLAREIKAREALADNAIDEADELAFLKERELAAQKKYDAALAAEKAKATGDIGKKTLPDFEDLYADIAGEPFNETGKNAIRSSELIRKAKLTAEQKEFIQSYNFFSGDGYAPIRDVQRSMTKTAAKFKAQHGYNITESRAMAKDLAEAHNLFKYNNTQKISRGIWLNKNDIAQLNTLKQIENMKPGDLYKDMGTSSWTRRDQVARDFAKVGRTDGGNVIFEIEGGTPIGHYVAPVSQYHSEAEVLVRAGQELFVKKVSKDADGIIRVTLEQKTKQINTKVLRPFNDALKDATERVKKQAEILKKAQKALEESTKRIIAATEKALENAIKTGAGSTAQATALNDYYVILKEKYIAEGMTRREAGTKALKEAVAYEKELLKKLS